jgi:hypothetical protein
MEPDDEHAEKPPRPRQEVVTGRLDDRHRVVADLGLCGAERRTERVDL